MSDELLSERCDTCDNQLVRTSADDVANSHDQPVVTCPSCLEIVRVGEDQ